MKQLRRTSLWLVIAGAALTLAGCGRLPDPTVTANGGDLVIHHQLDLYKLFSGTTPMFRDEAVLRFLPGVQPGTLELRHDPKTQDGFDRLHAFMREPSVRQPMVTIKRVSHPPEMPSAAEAYRVRVESRWTHEFLGRVDALTEYLVGRRPDGAVVFQPLQENDSELPDTAYNWSNRSQVIPLGAGAANTPARPAAVGEYAEGSREALAQLQQQVPALGEAFRNELINLGDE
ncbi:MAG: hypothetical protein ACREJ2_01660 [Planctomycetota bacterium]